MSALKVQSVVVGAGVVGLAVARTLARAGREVLIVEEQLAIGSGTSSRNSEVVHAGIYYPPGSLKARSCVDGREQLYTFCEAHGVAHRRCGKLIVASSEDECGALDQIARQAEANGVSVEHGLRRLTRAEAEAREPAVRCAGALLSPSTGIVDSHGFMLALLGGAQARGAELALGSRVVGCSVSPGGRGGLELRTADADGAECELECEELVNCAGHGAIALARSIRAAPPRHATLIPRARYAKGSYFALAGASPFSGLVYPVPQQAGLGVHATVALAGRCRFGPDVEWVEPDSETGALDYTVDPRRADAFYAEVRRYWPELPDGALVPDYAGVRPKLQAPGEQARDFELVGPAQHGVCGLAHLFGIESPGLTASLALAERVVATLDAEPAGRAGATEAEAGVDVCQRARRNLGIGLQQPCS